MTPPTPPTDPRRRSNTVVLLIITVALLGGWLVMWASGLFDQIGRGLSWVVLAGDAVILAVLWSVLFRKDLNRRP